MIKRYISRHFLSFKFEKPPKFLNKSPTIKRQKIPIVSSDIVKFAIEIDIHNFEIFFRHFLRIEFCPVMSA